MGKNAEAGAVETPATNENNSIIFQDNDTTKQAPENNFFDKLYKPRKPIEFIYEGLIPKGLPGGLFASGGTGKTFLCLQQAIYGAAGLQFGELKPTKPLKTGFWCAEDQERFLLERAEAIIDADPELKSKLDLIKENCVIESLAGIDASFLKMENSSIIQTDFYKRFKDKLSQHNGFDWLALDPLVSYWGLGENDAANGKELVRCLTEISMLTGASVQVSHHVSKSATRESISTSGGRGTSAIYDGLRWGFGLIKVLPTVSYGGREQKNKELQELRKLSSDSKGQFVKMFSAKSSHAPEIASTMTFKRGDKGQLECFDKANSIERGAKLRVVEFITDNPELTISQILRQSQGKELRANLKEEFNIATYQLQNLIDDLIHQEFIQEKTISIGKTSKKILLLNSN